MRDVRQTIIDALRDVYDPCCADRGLSVVDMGLVDDIRVEGEGTTVDLVLTSGWCPFMVPLVDAIRSRIEELALDRPADVRVVWNRAWTSARLSDTARQRLQFLPAPSEVGRDGPAAWAIGAPQPAAGPRPGVGPQGGGGPRRRAHGRAGAAGHADAPVPLPADPEVIR